MRCRDNQIMTSKEQVLKVFNHEEPDRVPFMYRDVPEVREILKMIYQ